MHLSLVSATLFLYSFKSGKLNFVISIFLLILFLSTPAFSETFSRIKNSFEDKRHRIKAQNASDISSISNGKGSIYLFWKESRAPMESRVYFTQVNMRNRNPIEIISKRISEFSTVQNNPTAISYIVDDAILAWKDYSTNIVGDIFMQRISDDQLLWEEGGIRVTRSTEQILNFSLSSDKNGNIFVSYITRSEFPSNDYKILYQRVLSDGSLTYKNKPILIESSVRKKNNLRIIQDNSGGAFILWTEKINNKESLLLKKVDPSGKSVLGSKPIKISGTLHNIVNFCESITNDLLLYIAWETKEKNIYHQLINSKGKAIWAVGGVKVGTSKGANIFPQVLQDDSLITLSWLNVFDQNNTLFVQKFKLNGKEIWTGKGIPVTSNKYHITNYSLANDNDGGVFITWMNKTPAQDEYNINIQSISNYGKLLWDTLKTNTNSFANCKLGYLSVYGDLVDQAVVVYETHSDEISVERAKNVQNPMTDFLSLTSALSGKSVKLNFNTNIQNEKMVFIVERLAHSDTSANVWEFIGTVDASPSDDITEYDYTDNPAEFGTLYYRAILKSSQKELLSNISRIDYLETTSKIIVAQNNPNPFRDSTIINFYLPVSATVGFEFFNGHAEKIEEMEEKVFPAGENYITFYANELKPGIYFFRFYTKDFVEVKKMVVD